MIGQLNFGRLVTFVTKLLVLPIANNRPILLGSFVLRRPLGYVSNLNTLKLLAYKMANLLN